MPPGVEPLAREPEELPRREVERHVRLMVGIDDDQVVALVRAAKERPGIGVVHGQAGVVPEPEEAAADAADGRIELDPVDAGLGVEDAERPRGRAGGVAEDRHGAKRPAEERRHRQERVPHPAREHRVRAPDRMDGDTLVQPQQALAVGPLDDLDELVERVLLVQQAAAPPSPRRAGARRVRRSRPRARAPGARAGRRRRARAAPRYRAGSAGFPRAGSRSAQARRCRAASRRSRARRSDPQPRRPSRRRRSRAGSRTARPSRAATTAGANRSRTAKNEPITAPAEASSRLPTAASRNGLRDERRDRDPDRRRQNDQAEQTRLRPPVGEAAAEPVAEREPGEHDPDQVRPDDRRRAEVGREQS